MKISVTRSGGFAGLTRKWSVTVSEDALEEQWQTLLDQLPWDQYVSGPPEPDRFTYRVRCANRQAVIPERRFTGAWQELLELVQQTEAGTAARKEKRGSPPHQP
ncbi:MAG: protealysin inhibitor emfourin [Terrimesophilobacter sp.]